MKHVNKIRDLVARHRKDERGSLSMPFAVSMLTLITAVGTTFDINQVQAASTRSQHIADMIGLTATVYVKNHSTPPTTSEEGFVENQVYSAKDMGYDVGPATSGDNDVSFTVTYDEANAQAIVNMSGSVSTSFMAMFGQKSLSFTSQSTVVYGQSDLKDPASVFLVLDNSGSMNLDDKKSVSNTERERPPGAQSRINGLKSTVAEFNTYLSESVGSVAGGNTSEYLRMAMAPYTSSFNSHRAVSPKWGTIPSGKITSMNAGGGTDSRQPMDQVYSWMLGENAAHDAMNGNDNPLKYVIFMTDGVNARQRVCTWEDQNGTGEWRRQQSDGSYEYQTSTSSPGSGWVEGDETCTYERLANSQTLETCTDLKNMGVEVYTIGYALETGYYGRSTHSSFSYQSPSTTSIAYGFLEACASSEDHFVKAENTEALQAAFDKIGKDIIEDVIRVAS